MTKTWDNEIDLVQMIHTFKVESFARKLFTKKTICEVLVQPIAIAAFYWVPLSEYLQLPVKENFSVEKITWGKKQVFCQ